VPSAPEFDNHRGDLPPSVRYVGPCLPDQPKGRPSGGNPCVVVDEGALYTAEPRVLEMAVRGLANLPLPVVLMAGLGRDLARLRLGPLPSNMTVQPHAPLHDMLPQARVLVTNGNSASVLAALQAGVPLVVLPSIWDQAEMAWRVQETGVGLRLSPWHATPRRMRRAVERVLSEPGFARNAASMGAALASYGGPARAVELIEGLCPVTA